MVENPKSKKIILLNEARRSIVPVSRIFGEGRKGGCLVLMGRRKRVFLQEIIGEPDSEKLELYSEFALEKALRLHDHPDHSLSWQSRDPENDKYGGAFRLHNGMILSFSGMPEDIDTPYSAYLGKFMGWSDDQYAITQMRICSGIQTYRNVCEVAQAA